MVKKNRKYILRLQNEDLEPLRLTSYLETWKKSTSQTSLNNGETYNALRLYNEDISCRQCRIKWPKHLTTIWPFEIQEARNIWISKTKSKTVLQKSKIGPEQISIVNKNVGMRSWKKWREMQTWKKSTIIGNAIWKSAIKFVKIIVKIYSGTV